MGLYPISHGGEEAPRISIALDTVRRRLQLYLTALWGQSFPLEPLTPDTAASSPARPQLRDAVIYLPASITARDADAAMAFYRGAAAHAAAHIMYSYPLDPQDLQPRQRLLVELVEDARVEYLASERFPGLGRLWYSLWAVDAPDAGRFACLVWKLCRTLLKPHLAGSGDWWLNKAVKLFQDRIPRLEDPSIAREIGLRLAHDLGQMRLVMNEGGAPKTAAYRDDNHHLWREERQILADTELATTAESAQGSRPEALLEEATHGRRFFFTESPADPRGSGASGHYVSLDTESPHIKFLQTEGVSLGTHVSSYPEWFEQIGMMRSNWCTVRDGPAEFCEDDIEVRLSRTQRHLVTQLSNVVSAFRVRRMKRRRALEHGDEIDLDAAIDDLVELRMGRAPAGRVYERRYRHDESMLAITLLMDVSESVNTMAPGTGKRVLDLAREAVLLLAQSTDNLGVPLAIAGFRSNGRRAVDYVRVKDFAQNLDAEVCGRLYGLIGRYSTRMGTAVRHASAVLAETSACASGGHRTLLMLTDGKPADVDVFDERHLVCDAREAVAQARRAGINVFCVSLDPKADNYVARIFGTAHFHVLDRLERLPEVLARLLARMVKRL